MIDINPVAGYIGAVHSAIESATRKAAFSMRRVRIDPEARGWVKGPKKDRSLSSLQEVLLCVIALWVLGLALFTILSIFASIQQPSDPIFDNVRSGTAGLLTVVVIWLLIFRGADTFYVRERFLARKGRSRSLKRCVRTALKLGINVVPVLTLEHVEVNDRFEDAIPFYGFVWEDGDFDIIRALLFEDLSRESVIGMLIEDRGMRTAAEISASLADFEATAKSLQSGWL